MKPVEDAAEDALAAGFQGAFFRKKRVAIAVPDLTRPVDYTKLLPGLLERLEGLAAEVTIVVALGLHRRLDDAELSPLDDLAARFGAEVVQHDARSDDLVEIAENVTRDDREDRQGWPVLPARFTPAIAEADRIICVGVVEPHQYAGFSGGAKTVAIGCGSYATISAMHGLEFLRDRRTALGRIEGNPFQEAIWEVARPLGPMFGLMVVPPSSQEQGRRECHDATFGPLYMAFTSCVEIAQEVFFEEVDEPFDWLHLPVSGPKAVNFYQASRAVTYTALVDRPAVRDGGLLVLEADCPEGIGQGAGEQACAEAMLRGKEALLAELRGEQKVQTRGGQQRAYVLAQALDRCDVAVVGAPAMAELEAMGIEQFDSLDEVETNGRGRTAPDVFHRVPRLTT